MDDDRDKLAEESPDRVGSCDSTMSRKEFVRLVLRRGAIVGAIIAAPSVVDKFVVPPAQAMMSSTITGMEGMGG